VGEGEQIAHLITDRREMNTDTIDGLIIVVKSILPNAEIFYAGDRVLIETNLEVGLGGYLIPSEPTKNERERV
jgi:hypothetical protein